MDELTQHRQILKPSRPLRVLLVAPSLGILGGQAIQAARLFDKLQEIPSLDVSMLPINPRLPGLLSKLQSIKYVRTLLTSLLYVTSLALRVNKYDLVHIFSASYFSFLLAPTPAVLIARLYGKKAILNYRSGEAEDHLQRWRWTAVPTIRLVDEIVVPSGYLVDVFSRFGLHARSIPNFVDTSNFRFRSRKPLRPVFLSTRNLEPLYNVGCTLRAFAIVQKRFPEARLTVAGDGSQRAALEDLASELGLRDIQFVGRVAPTQMPKLYDSADIYLNTPDIDNMPGSVIEAFASGLPVVTTNAGGIPYLIADGKNGLMTERGDHGRVAARAISLLENGTLALTIAENAYRDCGKYSWDSVRDEWMDLYCDVAFKDSPQQRQQGIDIRTVGKTRVPNDNGSRLVSPGTVSERD